MWREEARAAPWGAGSTRAMREVFGLERTDLACRGPMRPPPMIAMLSFEEDEGIKVVIVLAVGLEE